MERYLLKYTGEINEILLPENVISTKNHIEIKCDEWAEGVPEIVLSLRNKGLFFEIETKTFKILNFSCASCATSSETLIRYEPGVLKSQSNYATNTIQIEYLPEITNPKIFKKQLSELGFELIIEPENDTETLNFQKQKRNLIGAGIFAIPLFILGMLMLNNQTINYILWALCTPLVFVFGRHFF